MADLPISGSISGEKRVFGLAGWSGAGKTQLAEALISHFSDAGLRVATIKHAHHDFEADLPGKDSWRHRHAGAAQVLVSSAKRAALFTEYNGADEPDLTDLLAQLAPADLVLVEGFKTAPIPKLEVWRAALGKPQLYTNDANIIAIASDAPIDAPLPQLLLGDTPKIAAFMLQHLGLRGAS